MAIKAGRSTGSMSGCSGGGTASGSGSGSGSAPISASAAAGRSLGMARISGARGHPPAPAARAAPTSQVLAHLGALARLQRVLHNLLG
eukprot:6495126-Prymnesium_polylepis.1